MDRVEDRQLTTAETAAVWWAFYWRSSLLAVAFLVGCYIALEVILRLIGVSEGIESISTVAENGLALLVNLVASFVVMQRLLSRPFGSHRLTVHSGRPAA